MCNVNTHSKILCNVLPLTLYKHGRLASNVMMNKYIPRQLEKCEGSGLKIKHVH